MKRLHHGFWGVLCLALCTIAQAQTPVEFYQTWSGSGTRGWTNTDGSLSLSNPGGYLDLAFVSQAQPLTQAGVAFTNLISGVLPTNISFAFKSFGYQPSTVRLYVHTTLSNRNWYVTVNPDGIGSWNIVDVPVDFGNGWICDPGLDQVDFQADMLTADWVGVYIRRSGTALAHNYGLDDFLIQGVVRPSSLTISGDVAYQGEQSGTIYVSASSVATTLVAALVDSGPYAVTNVPLSQTYTVAAYRDSNGNNTQEFWEASGEWSGNPADLFVDDLTDADFVMSDPTSSDGLPYWWLNQFFGMTEEGGSGGSGTSQAQTDSDDDRVSNFNEYVAGTDPTNALSYFAVDITSTNSGGAAGMVLSWGSVPNRTYGIWRSTSIGGEFSKIESGLPATPPENSYEDMTATGRGPYFYRVEVEW